MKRLLLTVGALTAMFAGAEEPYLAENLSVWLRADRGLATNAAGGVTAWANQGTKGAAIDLSPSGDNSAGHVAYETSGIGGKPSLLFDGSVYLKTAKNGMVADHYEKLGFSLAEKDGDDTRWIFEIPDDYEDRNKHIAVK